MTNIVVIRIFLFFADVSASTTPTNRRPNRTGNGQAASHGRASGVQSCSGSAASRLFLSLFAVRSEDITEALSKIRKLAEEEVIGGEMNSQLKDNIVQMTAAQVIQAFFEWTL